MLQIVLQMRIFRAIPNNSKSLKYFYFYSYNFILFRKIINQKIAEAVNSKKKPISSTDFPFSVKHVVIKKNSMLKRKFLKCVSNIKRKERVGLRYLRKYVCGAKKNQKFGDQFELCALRPNKVAATNGYETETMKFKVNMELDGGGDDAMDFLPTKDMDLCFHSFPERQSTSNCCPMDMEFNLTESDSMDIEVTSTFSKSHRIKVV
jgi:hypothetical protein